jgi:hypothetical protein
MSALEKFVAMHGVMLFEACPIMENFATALQRAPENLGLLVAGAAGGSTTHHAAGTLFQKSLGTRHRGA